MKLLFIILLGIISLFIILNLTKPVDLKPIPKIIQTEENYWKDDFNKLDTSFWNIPERQALEGEIFGRHVGYFKKDNVWIKDGFLILRLIQKKGQIENNLDGVISEGAEIESKKKFGFGTYEWRMRTSSLSGNPKKGNRAVSGQISAGFNFVNNSETEIDFEVEGRFPEKLDMVNWKNPDISGFPGKNDRSYTYKTVKNMNNEFHTYKFVWTSKEIKFYVDNELLAEHKEHLPTAPAHFMVNHWGTNSEIFGGMATIGVERFLIVDWVSFTPLK